MIDQRQPVPHPLKPLQEPDQLPLGAGLQAAVLHQLHQMINTDTQGVQGRVDRGCAPDVHVPMILEHTFEGNFELRFHKAFY